MLPIFVELKKTFFAISATTTCEFQCPSGTMPTLYDRYTKDRVANGFLIHSINSDNTTTDVKEIILRPGRGRRLCGAGVINIMLTLTPTARSSDMLISLKAQGAKTVTFVYTYGSRTSQAHTVLYSIGKHFKIMLRCEMGDRHCFLWSTVCLFTIHISIRSQMWK